MLKILVRMLPTIAAVCVAIFLSVVVLGAAFTGEIVGMVFGSFVFGGLIGWGLSKVRVPYPWADLVGLAIVAFGSGFTNSAGRTMQVTWMLYGAAAVVAFFLLVMYHRAGRDEPEPTSRQEPSA